MEDKEKAKIILQANAIQRLNLIKNATVSPELRIPLDKALGFMDNSILSDGKKMDTYKLYPNEHWQQLLAEMIFRPLLEQGLDRFKEEVAKVIESGEVPIE